MNFLFINDIPIVVVSEEKKITLQDVAEDCEYENIIENEEEIKRNN